MAMLLPDAGNVVIENVKEDGAGIVVQARSCQTKVACPKCGSVAKRVHSRYVRQVRDVGWLGHPSRLVLVMRKFFCDVDDCPLRIFAEQLPRIVVRYGRRTVRLTERLRALGLSLGGNQAVAVSRKLNWLPASRRTKKDLKFRQSILEADAAIVQAVKLAHEFQALVRERNRAGLADWLAKAKVSGFADFVGFAKGIEMDLTAVENALSLEWSNGQVEGQVNRLKLIKRQMYGRAKFDLLRVLLG